MKIFEQIFLLILLSLVLFSCDRKVSISPPEQPIFETGKIFVDSKPNNFQIFIDGKATGSTTPDTVTWVKKGVHNLTLKKNLFENQKFTIKTTNDSISNFYYDYYSDSNNYSSIFITSTPPRCSIYLDDSLLNETTPFIIRPLFPGTYKVKLTYLGYRSDSSFISVSANKEIKLDLILPDTSVWITYNKENSQLISNKINTIYVDNNNLLWIGTNDGIVQKNGKIGTS